jgi:PBP1b-binding outer membrane lipoprotein LpoB
MKKLLSTAVVLLLVIIMNGCSREKSIYGNYEFDKIVYQSSLSSVSKDLLIEKMGDTEVKIKKDYFEITSPNGNYQISNPRYKKVNMNADLEKAFNDSVFEAIPITEYTEKYLYEIYTEDNDKAFYQLYLMDDEIWVADNSDYIMYIYRIRKLK